MGSPIILVMTTVDEQGVASKLSRELVEENLAACVSVSSPVTSVYSWEGEVVEDEEYPLLIKTTDSRREAVEDFLQTNHPYDCPEVLSLEVDEVSEDYGVWLREVVKS